jgi:hypothetical protein
MQSGHICQYPFSFGVPEAVLCDTMASHRKKNGHFVFAAAIAKDGMRISESSCPNGH